MWQSLSNTVKSLKAVRLATLLQRDPRTGFADSLQNRCSWVIHKIYRKRPVFESLFK